jgi:hypothetical protein
MIIKYPVKKTFPAARAQEILDFTIHIIGSDETPIIHKLAKMLTHALLLTALGSVSR